jgi:diguanylate cyclase (GGDEF)-like protein
MPPGWDGLKTIEEIWKIDPKMQIVVCTAYSDLMWKEVLARIGYRDNLLLLKKPFTGEEIYQLAIALSEKWQLSRNIDKQISSLVQVNEILQNEIANRKGVEEKLSQMAYFDRLTNLPNRFVLGECLERALARRTQSRDTFDALLFIDVDDFKLINDSLGHNAGDQLLVKIATRLREHLRCYDILESKNSPMAARLGGDEFVVLIEDLHTERNAAMIAKRIGEMLSFPYDIHNQEVTVSTSIGVAIINGDVHDSEEVFRNADIAMYHAKACGKNQFSMFDSKMHDSVVARLESERDLRSAIENEEFELHFQPIVSLNSMSVTNFEALIRWRKPNGKIVPPDQFIKLAEETGMIVPIGRWVIENACKTLQKWDAQFGNCSNVAISVNVSKRQFAEGNFVEDFQSLLRRFGIDGSRLHIEVTESVVMQNPAKVVERLQELQKLGIQIHMDDFGTGHSSLSCLHQFPINVLKIDRSFISTMQANSSYAAIVETIVSLAHNLGMDVTAEGIETIEQLGKLQSLGCNLGQGYYFAKPLPFDQIQLPFPMRSETPAHAGIVLKGGDPIILHPTGLPI